MSWGEGGRRLLQWRDEDKMARIRVTKERKRLMLHKCAVGGTEQTLKDGIYSVWGKKWRAKSGCSQKEITNKNKTQSIGENTTLNIIKSNGFM